MMKTLRSALLVSTIAAALLTGCGSAVKETTVPNSAAVETSAETSAAASDLAESTAPQTDRVPVRVGSLKGPTSMGLVDLMDQNSKGETANDYTFTMVTAADELLGQVVSGKLDLALIPANVAAVLYHKTKGQISVLNINTLGVLYLVSADDSVQTISDLKGKTIYLTGKGTTPDYVLHYLLNTGNLSEEDVTLEYKSEPTEVAALLKEKPDAIGLLPQPFVTAACAQNESLKIVLDLTKEWNQIQGNSGSQLVTGVTIVRNDFLKENEEAVHLFLKEHAASADYANNHVDKTAELIAAAGIIEKAPIAKKAIPYCNITCISGEEMKTALSGYLNVLFEQNPESIGGSLPEDNFYLIFPQ